MQSFIECVYWKKLPNLFQALITILKLCQLHSNWYGPANEIKLVSSLSLKDDLIFRLLHKAITRTKWLPRIAVVNCLFCLSVTTQLMLLNVCHSLVTHSQSIRTTIIDDSIIGFFIVDFCVVFYKGRIGALGSAAVCHTCAPGSNHLRA